jgi:hypothetical protein
LWSKTFATTFEAIIGFERILEKFLVKDIGSTLSSSPPVSSDNLLRASRLHSSPTIDTMFTVNPLVFAY